MGKYRYLFSQLVHRELRQKYKGSVLGVVWYLVNPIVLMIVYGVMLGPVLKAVHYPDYPLFILAGLLVWLFFSQALIAAAASLVDQSSLISKIRFPRESIPGAATAVQLVPFFAMLALLLPVTLVIRGNPSWSLLLLIPVTVCLFAFTLGLALIVAVAHAYYRDVVPVLTAALLPWFFVSGVLFDLQSLPGLSTHHWIEPLLRWANPVAPFIAAMRDIVYGGTAPGLATMGYLVAAAVTALAAGVAVFRRGEGELAVVL